MKGSRGLGVVAGGGDSCVCRWRSSPSGGSSCARGLPVDSRSDFGRSCEQRSRREDRIGQRDSASSVIALASGFGIRWVMHAVSVGGRFAAWEAGTYTAWPWCHTRRPKEVVHMYLSDTKNRELIDRKVLLNADVSNIGQVTYDLRTDGFFIDGNKRAEVELNSGDSTFVSCVESVQLPNDLTASVLLRNSRICLGLSLDVPLYFPGHGTRLFYRVTNVSGNVIALDRSKGIAQVAFQHVDGTVANSHEGAFPDELDFSGLAGYSDIYAGELKKVENRREEVEHIESRSDRVVG